MTSILKTTAFLFAAIAATCSHADIVFEIQDATVVQGTPGAALDVLVSSTAADSPLSMTLGFQVIGATFLSPPGIFDQPGFYNEGNYNNAASFFLVDPNDQSVAVLSLDIETAAPIASQSVLARLFVDSENLAVGDYEIQITRSDAFEELQGGGAAEIATSSINGTLAVTAIPEPGSVLALSVVATGLMVRRRRGV